MLDYLHKSFNLIEKYLLETHVYGPVINITWYQTVRPCDNQIMKFVSLNLRLKQMKTNYTLPQRLLDGLFSVLEQI